MQVTSETVFAHERAGVVFSYRVEVKLWSTLRNDATAVALARLVTSVWAAVSNWRMISHCK